MGCKEVKACKNNKSQNFYGKWSKHQCRPWKWWKRGPSVCRQCCNAQEDCAKDFVANPEGSGPLSTEAWKENLLI